MNGIFLGMLCENKDHLCYLSEIGLVGPTFGMENWILSRDKTCYRVHSHWHCHIRCHQWSQSQSWTPGSFGDVRSSNPITFSEISQFFHHCLKHSILFPTFCLRTIMRQWQILNNRTWSFLKRDAFWSNILRNELVISVHSLEHQNEH
jgi:hypothetical protein